MSTTTSQATCGRSQRLVDNREDGHPLQHGCSLTQTLVIGRRPRFPSGCDALAHRATGTQSADSTHARPRHVTVAPHEPHPQLGIDRATRHSQRKGAAERRGEATAPHPEPAGHPHSQECSCSENVGVQLQSTTKSRMAERAQRRTPRERRVQLESLTHDRTMPSSFGTRPRRTRRPSWHDARQTPPRRTKRSCRRRGPNLK